MVTDSEIDEMIRMCDTDGIIFHLKKKNLGDGQVSFLEFSRMVFKYCGPPVDEKTGIQKEEEKEWSQDRMQTIGLRVHTQLDREKGREISPVSERGEAESKDLPAFVSPLAVQLNASDEKRKIQLKTLPAPLMSGIAMNGGTVGMDYQEGAILENEQYSNAVEHPLSLNPHLGVILPTSSMTNPIYKSPMAGGGRLPPASQFSVSKLPPLSVTGKSDDPAKRRSDLREICDQMNIKSDSVLNLLSRFSKYETSGESAIDFEGFNLLLAGNTNEPDVNKQIEALFYLFDSDNDGKIDFREFVLATLVMLTQNKDEKVKHAFHVFDIDHDGYLNKVELMKVLRSTYMAAHDSQVEKKAAAILRQADVNNDGRVSFDEFLTIHKKYPNLLFPAAHATKLLQDSTKVI